MQKYTSVLFLSAMLLCLLTSERTTAQKEKSLNESLKDLKKSFHPDKNFIMPFSDSTNEDLQAFLFAVRETKGVKNAWIKMDNQKVVVVVEAKGSMVSVWNNLEKEFRNRYTVTERTPQGFILADSYQTNNETSAAHKEATKDVQKQNTKSVFEQAEQDAAKDYKNPDTTKGNKSIWQQQKDYAEQMRQRDKDRWIGSSEYANDTVKYKSLKPVLGNHFFAYKINGKTYSINSKSNHPISAYGARSASYNGLLLTFSDAASNLYFTVDMSDPVKFPNTRKFLFGSEEDEDGDSALQMHVPNFVFTLKYPMKTVLSNPPTGFGSPVLFASDKPGATWGDMTPNVISGFIEIYNYSPGTGGWIEGRFQLKVKDSEVVTKGKTAKIPPFTITEGKFRTQIRY